jgi:hypothetical protein
MTTGGLVREATDVLARKPHASCRLLSYEGFFNPHSIPPTEISPRMSDLELKRLFGEIHRQLEHRYNKPMFPM